MAQITVLFPIHAIHPYLGDAISSLLNQSFQDFEVIFLVNQPCEEAFRNLIGSDCCPSISQLSAQIISFPSINHLSYKLNYGISLSHAKYIARMDSDDICHPDRFQYQFDFLEKNPDCGIVGCRITLIDEESQVLSNNSFAFVEHDHQIRRLLPFKNSLCHPALMFRTSTLLNVNGYTYGGRSEDHDLFIRIMINTNYTFYNLPFNLFFYRRHADQITSFSNASVMYSDIASFTFKYFLLTHNPFFLIPIIVYNPLARRLRSYLISKTNKRL